MTTDKLSATDRAFLAIEEGALRMHVAAVMVFDGGDFVADDGALDAARLTALLAAGVAREPRFRQRVREVPGLGAVWEDDPHHRVEHHIVHTAVPRPGDARALMALAGRLLAQPLDRRRPLWEMWLIEGLADRRFALVVKAHHAMLDGVAGLGVLASLLRPDAHDPDLTVAAAPARAPQSTAHLVSSLAADGAHQLAAALHDVGAALAHPAQALGRARELVEGLVETLHDGLSPAPATSINPGEVGPHRAFAGTHLPMARVTAVRHALGATVNEIVLAVVTAALRAYLARRGDDVDDMGAFRALVPVNLRPRQGLRGPGHGNHVALLLAALPVAEPDARARFAAVRRTCEHFKHASHEVDGVELVERVGDLGGPNLVAATFRIAAKLRAFNVVVTNVPGPSSPLYLGRARLAQLWGEVPLFAHQGVGIAAISYDDRLSLGLHADPDAVPDLAALVGDLERAFDEVASLAG